MKLSLETVLQHDTLCVYGQVEEPIFMIPPGLTLIHFAVKFTFLESSNTSVPTIFDQ